MTTGNLIAPNKQTDVQYTIDTHPEIDTMDEVARGEIIDITARRINPGHGEKPWGRKARTNDPNNPNCNTDGMTFLRPDGLFEIYDCISGVDGQSTWEGYGPFAPGENGYWWPPGEVEDSGTDGGGELQALIDRVVALETAVAELQTTASDHEIRIATLETKTTGPFRAHGPIDLPVVVDGFSLRTRGDIDVDVKPGEATPPPPPSEPDLKDKILWKRFIDRIRDEESAKQ